MNPIATRSARRRSILSTRVVPTTIVLLGAAAMVIADTDVILPSGGNPYVLDITSPPPIFKAGLYEGFVGGNLNDTTANPANGPQTVGTESGVSLDIRMGQIHQEGNQYSANGWNNDRTWIYTGQVLFTDAGAGQGFLQFAENIDDKVKLFMDGAEVTQFTNDQWNVSFSTGVLQRTAGWHNFELRMSNGGGGAGPVSGNGWVDNGSYNGDFTRDDFGFGIRTPTGAADDGGTNGANYAKPVDNGSMSLFRHQAGSGFDHIFRIQNDSEIQLTATNGNTAVTEVALKFESNTSAFTLTGAGKTLSLSQGTTLATTTNHTVTLGGDANLVTGALSDGTASVILNKTGSGTVTFDSPTNDLNGTTLNVAAGTVSVVSAAGANPLATMTQPIHLTGTGAILRVGGQVNTTFNLALAVEQSATLEHTATTADTFGSAGNGVTISAGKTFTANVTGGSLTLPGAFSGAAGATFVKAGGNTLTLSGAVAHNGGINVQGGTLNVTSGDNTITGPVQVSGGTVVAGANNALGTAAVRLQGGTLQIGSGTGLLGEYYTFLANNVGGIDPSFVDLAAFNAHLSGVTPDVTALTTTGGVTTLNFANPDGGSPNGGGNGAPFASQGFNNADNINSRMSGKIYVPVTGTYTFATRSDDGSVIFIDGANTPVVNNNFYQGIDNSRRAGTINLTAGYHDIVIGFFEGGGGAGLEVKYTPIGGVEQFVPNDLLFTTQAAGSPSLTNVVDVQSSSTIVATGITNTIAGLTLHAGADLTVNGNAFGSLIPTGGTTFANAGNYNLVVNNGEASLGAVSGSGAVTLNKSGTGQLVIENSTANPAALPSGSAVNVNAGRLSVLTEAGAASPLGNAAINIANGGGADLSSKNGNVSFTNALNFAGSGALSAGAASGATNGAVNVTVGSLSVASGNTLALSSAKAHTLLLTGTGSGGGNLGVTSGTVTAQTGTALNGFGVSLTPGINTTLNVPSGGTITSLASSAGTSLVLGGGTLAVTQSGDTIVAGTLSGNGTLAKAGAGTLTLTGTANAGHTGGLTVSGGVLALDSALAAGSGTFTLAGGTLRLPLTGLVGNYYNGDTGAAQTAFNTSSLAALDAYFAGKTPAVTARTTTGGTTQLSFVGPNGTDFGPFASQGFGTTTDVQDQIQAKLTGVVSVLTGGSYEFGTRSDDGSTLYIDGVRIVDNNFYQGMTTRSGTVTLTPGAHAITIGFYEGGGGAGLEVYLRPTSAGGALENYVLKNAVLGGFHGSNEVLITGDSTIDLQNGAAELGETTISPGKTLTVSAGALSLQSTSFSGAGTFGINKDTGTLQLGSVSAANVVTINKGGVGTVVFDTTTSAQLATVGSTLNVTGGLVAAVGQNGAFNPIGVATVNLNGGGLALGSKGGDVSFNNAINIQANAALTAGKFGATAVAGPLTVNIAASGLSIGTGRTLTTSTTDNYALNIGGAITGGGSLVHTAGTLTLASNAALGSLTAAGGVIALNPGGGNTATVAGATSLNGGTLRVQSGTADFGSSAITATAATVQSGSLLGKLFVLGADNDPNIRLNPVNEAEANTINAATPTASASLNATHFPGTENGSVNGDLHFGPQADPAADAVFTTFFNGAGPGSNNFTAGFVGRFTAPESGGFQFKVDRQDDQAAFWVDLNQNGVFESNGSAGNERVSFVDGCCGNPNTPDTVNLVSGQIYNVLAAVQDTGVGSSLEARFATPSSPSLSLINPGNQTTLWSSVSAGGGLIDVTTGAELRAGSLLGASRVALAAGGILRLTAAGTSSADAVSSFAGAGQTVTLDLAASTVFNVDHLSIARDGTFIKQGNGLIDANGQSLGNGSTLQINAGTVRVRGTAAASNGSANGGNIVVNATGIFDVRGSIAGAINVNANGKLMGTGTLAGATTIGSGGVLSPGAGPGTLTSTGALTLGDGAVALFELGSTAGTSDHVALNGGGASFTTAGAWTLKISEVGVFAPTGLTFVLFDGDNSAASLAGFTQPTLDFTLAPGWSGGLLSYDPANNDILLTQVIPEPSALLTLLGGAGLLLGLQRTRRRAVRA